MVILVLSRSVPDYSIGILKFAFANQEPARKVFNGLFGTVNFLN